MNSNILQYESQIWKTADLLIGAGIKQSDFPKYMMPFFALLMVESRLFRSLHKLKKDNEEMSLDDFAELFELEGMGYNEYVVKEGKSLQDICKNDKAFQVDFISYLKGFDGETKHLLGVDKGSEDEKFLDISGIASLLQKKGILFDTVKAWSSIDLTPFDNSEITTLEEHIKRKWADISAETAGEQYTPQDIISLITEIIASKIEDNGNYLTIYDPTCGGGNLLFGVEDKIKNICNRPIKTIGDEWNDALYALAKIESRFRGESDINHCNTLTAYKHSGQEFSIVVANPPYGVDWKGYQKDINADQTGRFVDLPSISDGQFLFAQHILHHLKTDGLSIVVQNGSTLFSGDAGTGESNIRKHFFDNDWVEAIIQMPTDEFFNTGIYTYLWIFNKSKPTERKDKVILIDASNHFQKLKKSKGKKRKEITPYQCTEIVQALTDFTDNDFSKVFDKWHFYYNKQTICLTNVDDNGKALEMPTKINKAGDKVEEKSIKLEPSKISFVIDGVTQELTEFEISTAQDGYDDLKIYNNQYYKEYIARIDDKDNATIIETKEASYWFDGDKNTIVKKQGDTQTELGCGKIQIKSSFSKATKTRGERIRVAVTLVKDTENDYEIIPYSPNNEQNQRNIADFMEWYITRPFEYVSNVVGVELNFNKVFYKPEQLRDLSDIQADLDRLNKELQALEGDL